MHSLNRTPHHPNPTPFHKRGRGWDFSKMALMEGWKIFTRNGGKPEIGGDRTFWKSLYVVSRRLPPILWRSHYITYPLFQILPVIPCHLPPQLNCSFCCPLSLAEWWSCHIWCAILLNDYMDRHMSSLGTLVPEGLWCAIYAARRQVYTHTNMHSTFRGHPVDRHTHINIYLQHLLCSHSSYHSYIKRLNE